MQASRVSESPRISTNANRMPPAEEMQSKAHVEPGKSLEAFTHRKSDLPFRSPYRLALA